MAKRMLIDAAHPEETRVVVLSGNRHGFLAFSEIHPDYYRIPVSDRSGRNGEAAKPSGRGAANGGDDAGVPLAAALPEPVPVPVAGSGEEDTSPEEERAP